MPYKNVEDRRRVKRAWSAANPDKRAAQARRHHARRRARAIAALGGKCSQCGITDPCVLEIDHVNDDGAEDRKRYADGNQMYGAIIRGEQTAELQVLCANCHLRKTRKCGN